MLDHKEIIMKTVNAGAYRSHLVRSAFFGALALSLGAVLMAGEPVEMRQTVVKYGDLNLSNPQGAKALYRRISAAAHEVCEPLYDGVRDLGVRQAAGACVHKAVDDAVNAIRQPQLSAVHAANTHQPATVFIASTDAR